jgi:hypothetical protein
MNPNSNVEARKLVLGAIIACFQQIWISWCISLSQLLNQLTIFTKCDKNIRPLKSTQTSHFPISYCQMMDDNRPQTNIRPFMGFFWSLNLKQYGSRVKYIFSFQFGGYNYELLEAYEISYGIIKISTNIYMKQCLWNFGVMSDKFNADKFYTWVYITNFPEKIQTSLGFDCKVTCAWL